MQGPKSSFFIFFEIYFSEQNQRHVRVPFAAILRCISAQCQYARVL